MFIDCQRCQARGAGCGDCAAATLLGATGRARTSTTSTRPSSAR